MDAHKILYVIDHLEKYICQLLLSFFAIVLFAQIMLRALFNIVLPWSEEISRFSFVWFVFLGASYASRLAAHNRVTLQFKLFRSEAVGNYCMLFSDAIWILFNVVMIKESLKVIANLNAFSFYSPALGWNMALVYYIFPISFTLMTIRILQVNYIKFVLKQEIVDVDKVNPEDFKQIAEEFDSQRRM